MTKPILVTAGIIRKGDKILIAQRKKDSKLEPSKWEFPGGKVEFLEHPEDCLIREIKEEMGITISVDKLLTVNSHIYNVGDEKYHIMLMAFLCDWVEGEVKNIDVQDAKWINYDEFKDFEFAGADVGVVDFFRKNF